MAAPERIAQCVLVHVPALEDLAHQVHPSLLAIAQEPVALLGVLLDREAGEPGLVVEEESRAALQQSLALRGIGNPVLHQPEPGVPLHGVPAPVGVAEHVRRTAEPSGGAGELHVARRALVRQHAPLPEPDQLVEDALPRDRAVDVGELGPLVDAPAR